MAAGVFFQHNNASEWKGGNSLWARNGTRAKFNKVETKESRLSELKDGNEKGEAKCSPRIAESQVEER
jgi:hypothetical protein